MRDIVLYEIRKSIEEINELELSPSDIIDGDQSEQEQLLVDTVRKLIDLSYVARKEGLLALEEKAGVLPDTNGYDTLKMLLMLIVDGTDPDLVEEMALMKYFASGVKGYRALQHLIMMIGVADIQAGANPRVFEEKIILALPKHLAEAERRRLKDDSHGEVDIKERFIGMWR